VNFKNKFNKFKQYSEYFNDLNDAEIHELLDGTAVKIEKIDSLTKEAKDVCSEVVSSMKQSVKLGLNLKNINVKKLKKALSELKDLIKAEPADEDKQAVELMIELIELFIENYSNMRNW
jgi:predicted Zn-dependent protease